MYDFRQSIGRPDRICERGHLVTKTNAALKFRRGAVYLECAECAKVRWREHSTDPDFIRKRKTNEHKYRASHRRERLDRQYRSKFGIGLSDKFERVEAQEYKCANTRCGAEITYSTAHTDHDHETGVLRGFLCSGCNLALGHLKDNAERARGLGEYLDKHKDAGLCPAQ